MALRERGRREHFCLRPDGLQGQSSLTLSLEPTMLGSAIISGSVLGKAKSILPRNLHRSVPDSIVARPHVQQTISRRSLFHYSLKDLDTNERQTTLFVPPKDKAKETASKPSNDKASLKQPLESLQKALEDRNRVDHLPQMETKVTKLANGMTVASEDTFSQMTNLGVYVKAGSRYEDPSEVGMGQLVERLMFRSTQNQTRGEVIGKLEDMGSTASSLSYPDMLVLQGSVLREYVDPYLNIMADSLLRPVFTTEEVQEQVQYMMEDWTDRRNSPHVMIEDAIHRQAYKGSPLSQIQLSDNLNSLTAESVYHYMKRNWTGPRFILTAVDVDHQDLVKLAQKHFSALPSMPLDGSIPSVSPVGIPPSGSMRARYVGGMELIAKETEPDDPEPIAMVALGFEGLALTDPNIHMMFALSSLMGGGDSFSSGGPGKGIHSKLYRNVLSRYSFVSHCSVFIHSYADSAVFGVLGHTDPRHMQNLVDIICQELTRITHNLDSESVERAKNALKSQIFYNLELRPVIIDDIARYMLALGRRYSAAEICAQIDAITVESMQNFAQHLLKSPPVVAGVGPQRSLKKMPTYESIEKYFEKHLSRL